MWPNCLATPSDYCGVTAGLVSLHWRDIPDKKVTKCVQKWNSSKTLKMHYRHLSYKYEYPDIGEICCLQIIVFLDLTSLNMFMCIYTVYPKKYAHGFRFAVLCCGYTLTDFPISIRLTSLALWQSNDCPSASKATLMNMGKCIMWIDYEWLHNHNKAKHNKTVCKFLGIYCMFQHRC